jgi:Na+/H+ antiporter NhaB
MPAVMALSFPCTPLAKSGIAAIQAVYVGTEQAKDIQELVKGNAGLCDKDGPAAPMKFHAEVSVP